MTGEKLLLSVPRFPVPSLSTDVPKLSSGREGQPNVASRVRSQFNFIPADEIGERPPPPWLVHGLLPAGAVAVLIGRPGDGKTFLGLDLCLSVSQGLDFHGFRTRGGATVYVAAEGATGLGQRVSAYKSAHGLRSLNDAFVIEEPLLMTERGELDRFIESVNEQLGLDPVLIVIDTLARAIPGRDENSATDMGLLIAQADRLRKEYDATVLFIHHLRVDGERERGSTALRGGADTMILVKKNGSRLTVSCEKQKDAAPFEPFQLYLTQVNNAAVLSATLPTDEQATPPLTPSERTALIALSDTIPMTFKAWQEDSGLQKSTFKNLPSRLAHKALIRATSAKRWIRTAAGSEQLGLSSQTSLIEVSEDQTSSGLRTPGPLGPGPETEGLLNGKTDSLPQPTRTYGCERCGRFSFVYPNQVCYLCRNRPDDSEGGSAAVSGDL